ncbi:hypothetical protein QVD17_16364 [Tagetes erecta]|uniref:Uncharacterized protein n=1 Tax=Tagetes erecta TaxID=13708 RepID=A0AAD8KRB9_TARER|nr:hypothetical protein QVD17_16364 [Tagetes erecta]
MDDYKVLYVHGEAFETQDVGQCSIPVPSQHASQYIDDDHGEYYRIWGSKKQHKKFVAGKRKRASVDNSGKRSRHTSGSVGFDEHRIRLTHETCSLVYLIRFELWKLKFKSPRHDLKLRKSMHEELARSST